MDQHGTVGPMGRLAEPVPNRPRLSGPGRNHHPGSVPVAAVPAVALASEPMDQLEAGPSHPRHFDPEKSHHPGSAPAAVALATSEPMDHKV